MTAKKESETAKAKEMSAEKEAKETAEGKKKRKVKKLSLQEVEEKLKMVQATMGGFTSKYAQHLLRRKEELLKKKKQLASGQ